MTTKLMSVSPGRKLDLCRFAVTGAGNFPIDMLAYGDCRAASEADQLKIDWQVGDSAPAGTGALYHREIWLLASIHHGGVNHIKARWVSYGWRVVALCILKTETRLRGL